MDYFAELAEQIEEQTQALLSIEEAIAIEPSEELAEVH